MRPNDAVFDSAVPHEAGHVLVAYSFGIPVRQIGYRIRSERDARIISEIAQPSPAADEQEKLAHCIVASAGMAGEVVARGIYDPTNLDPRNPDNVVVRILAGVGAEPTDFLQAAKEVIDKNRQAFDRLCLALIERYPAVRAQIISIGQPGIYALLVKENLDKILAEVTPGTK